MRVAPRGPEALPRHQRAHLDRQLRRAHPVLSPADRQRVGRHFPRQEPPMTSAVIVSTARTPLAKSWKGAFNMTHGATLGGHAVKAAVERAGIDAAEVDDVIMGCATPEGATGSNIARQIALRAGLPITTSGMTVNRFCSSGLQTIAMAAQRIIAGENDIVVAGGVEIDLVRAERGQQAHARRPLAGRAQADDLLEHAADRRAGRQALQDRSRAHGPLRRREPAEGDRRARRRPVRRRDDPGDDARRRRRRAARPAHEGSDDQRRRRHPPRHDLRRHQGHQAGDSRRRDLGRQRQPVQRRRRRGASS